MRLIDADRLLSDRMKKYYYHLKNGDIAIPIIDIEHAPTIDAVSVVRCDNCKYRYMDADLQVWTCTYGLMIKPNGFCNYGERKGE